jgi:type IV pilus secretin PilQ/predicted competence protein
MRIQWRALGLGALLAAGLIWTNGALRASDAPVVHVKAEVKDGAVRLQAEANAPFEYTTYRPSDSLYVLDLSGVSAGDPAGARVVASDLVKSYRVITYAAGAKPVVRLEILLAQGLEPRLERQGKEDLTLFVTRAAVSASSSMPIAAKATFVSAAAKPSDMNLGAHQAIRQVHLAQNGTATEVSISGSGPLSYHSIHLQNPDRLVLDFAGSHLTTTEKQIASNLDPVREIRLAQFTPEVSRVVIDLREPARYSIKGEGNIVTVSFVGKAAAATSSSSAATADSAAMVAPKSASSINTATEQAAATKPAEIPAPAAVLPAALTQTSSALATPVSAPPQQPETIAATRAAVSTASSTDAAPTATSAPMSAPAQPMMSSSAPITQASATSSAPPVGKYSGEPISVNLKDVDLRDFFRLIHEISGLNVVVDPGVKGNLTIVLDDVPWDQALDIVLKNNDLDKQLDGNVLRLATKETLRKEAEENRDLAKAVAEAADVVTTTRVLSYAKSTDMSATLKKFLSSRGDIIADDRSNTLIIRDIPSTLPVMDNLIRQLDRKSQQVEIEARVVAANRSFSREIGTQFAFAGSSNSGNNVIGGVTGVGTSPIIRPPLPFPQPPVVVSSGSSGGSSMPLITNLGVGSPTSGISYAYSNANFALDLIITAAEERGVGKLLSKPKIITQNNEKATVKQGTKIPVQTIVNNTVSVQFVDAVLQLDVTPQITADGTIYMDVNVENDQIDGSIPRVQGIPAIDTQEAQTKVTVNDGATVVIGGIIVTQQTTDIQQVPFVGSVPVLGNLFKHTTVKSTSQELLFFLTPRILPS